MEFHLYYLIQDIVGVLIAFLGVRMFLLSIKIASVHKVSKSSTFFLLIRYTLMILAGANLLLNNFGLKPWIISIILMVISLVPISKK